MAFVLSMEVTSGAAPLVSEPQLPGSRAKAMTLTQERIDDGSRGIREAPPLIDVRGAINGGQTQHRAAVQLLEFLCNARDS